MRHRFVLSMIGFLAMTLLLVCQSAAAEFSVAVKNLTNGIYFTPLLSTADTAASSDFIGL